MLHSLSDCEPFPDINRDVSGDPDTVRSQIRQVVSKLQESDEVRDSVLNNDEDMQMQVIHDNIHAVLVKIAMVPETEQIQFQ